MSECLSSHAPEDTCKPACLRSFKLEITCRPFVGNLISLFFNGWRWDFQVRRKWQFEKFQDPLRGDAVRRDDVFIKENQRLNLIVVKIVHPAVIVCCDPVAPFVDYLEIELGYGARVRFFFCFLTSVAFFACPCPGSALLE